MSDSFPSWNHVLAATALCFASACSGDPEGPSGTTGGATTGAVGQATAGIDAGGQTAVGTGNPMTTGTTGGGATSTNGTVQSGTGIVPSLEPVFLDDCGADNPAGLSPEQVTSLKAGGGTPPQMLYPYDGTVFPRGLTSPTLMWNDNGAQAVYVHIQSKLFEYSGCLPVDSGGAKIPQTVWDTAAVQTGGSNVDPFEMTVSTLSGGAAAGPVTQKFIIAKGSLKGAIYYNSYNSSAGGGLGGLGGALDGLGLGGIGNLGGQGAILRLRPGQDAELFLRQGTCTGCHSLSANGERMLTAEIGGAGGGLPGGLGAGAGAGQIFSIDPTTGPNPPPTRASVGAAFGGLTPDGQYFLSSAANGRLGPLLNGGTAPPVANAVLYETDTGTTLDSGVPPGAMMPTFSADGTLVTFNDHATDDAHSLQLMDFDPQTQKASNLRTVYTSPDGYIGWPFIMPDNRGIVFTVTQRSDFGGGGWGIIPALGTPPRSDVMFLDLKSGEAHILAKAMGYRTLEDAVSETTYLPFGTEELHGAYYPTVSPIAAGGYFWVFFDSVRHYGNKGLHRNIWGTAIEIPQSEEFNSYNADPSAPMFYLEGQELEGANHRAFTVLDPCKADGQSCESGTDCCGGFCTEGICGVDAPRCSEEGEACETSADCCDPAFACINGFCSIVLI